MTNDTGTLEFADLYASFRSDLEGGNGSIGYLSQRGLADALLTLLRELPRGTSPVAAITEAINTYYECERKNRGEYQDHIAAEERRHAEWVTAETLTRTAACPTCGARPGDLCRRPTGRPAAESHRHRYHAARQPGDGQAAVPSGSA